MEDMHTKLDKLDHTMQQSMAQCSVLLFFLDSRLVKEYYLGMERNKVEHDKHAQDVFSLMPNPNKPRFCELTNGGAAPNFPNVVARADGSGIEQRGVEFTAADPGPSGRKGPPRGLFEAASK